MIDKGDDVRVLGHGGLLLNPAGHLALLPRARRG